MPPRPAPPRLTHFLCIPLVTPTSRSQLQKSLATFRSDVTKSRTPENPDGIPERAIRPLGTLHLTLGVMSLLTPEKVESALSVLKSLNLKDLLAGGMKPGTVKDEGRVSVSDGKKVAGSDQDDLGATSKLSITLRGLASMHAPEKTSILYSSPVDEDQRIQTFCQRLKDAFSEAEMLVKDTGPLLLHATVVNTIYVPGIRGKGSGHGKNRAKLTLDAREILDDYEEFEWMKDVRVEKVALCRMGAQKTEGGEEEYIVEGEVEMP